MEIDKLTSLVCAVQQGDRQAADELYTAVHQGLYYYISKTVDDPELAQDLLQETFMEIYQTIGNLKEPAAFLKWSRQIAYHKCTAHSRKTKDITVDENEDGQSIFDTIEEERTEFIPDEALDKEDLKQTIHAMLAELPMEQRSAIMLRYFDEISVKEIAEIQGVTEGTVKSRLNYGRKALQKSVEDYEKKNNVKLHCAGVIPLLLWLFREYAVANKISLTATTASASYVAAAAPTTYAAANAAAPIVAEGAKAAGKFAVKKLIAGIAAAAIITGGVAVGLSSQTPQDSTPGTSTSTEATSTSAPNTDQTETTAPDAVVIKTGTWYGYGEVIIASGSGARFEIEITSVDETQIQGTLTRSKLYNLTHQTSFTGTGKKTGDQIEYEISFESPLVMNSVYERTVLVYDIQTDCFWMNELDRVTLVHISNKNDTPIAEDKTWSGYGKDIIGGYSHRNDHLFVLHVDRMSESEIYGTLTIYHKDAVDHTFSFSGYGYRSGNYHYQIRLDASQSDEKDAQYHNDVHLLNYNDRNDTFDMGRPYIVYLYSENLPQT